MPVLDMQPRKNTAGFTIVELLIVIVVIGILVAITIVAFNGVQQRARVATLQSDLSTAAKQLKLYTAEKGSLPTGNDCSASPAINTICLKSSGSNSYTTFSVNNASGAQSFCLTATNSGTNYRVTEKTSPLVGDCVNLYASGGVITDVAGYRIHTFTSSGQFTVSDTIGSVAVLVVAGGGGAGADVGGAGGGGGLIYQSAFAVSPGQVSVTVGAGGGNLGANGNNSVFSSLTALGGGGGGNYSTTAGKAGGSGGGGGGGGANAGGIGAIGQGFDGGLGASGTYSSGAGGGAGGVGGTATSAVGTNGGIGKAYTISGTSTYYSGGGGGGGSTSYGQGGLGGGGTGEGRTTNNGQNGTPNTGGGAGGHASANTGGATGGSGVVIIRYQLP